MEIDEIRTPEDILDFMKEHIQYGWLDIDGHRHIGDMKDFRRKYLTRTVDECLKLGLGTCIDQVAIMNELFNRIGIPHKMYCCRIFEPDDYGNLEEDEHMHCFLLYEEHGRTYQLEHPNLTRIGVHEYESKEEAIQFLTNYYLKIRGGQPSSTTEFYEIKPGLSFREFNNYINSLDRKEV